MPTDDESGAEAPATFEEALGKAIAIRRLELGLKRNDLRDRSGLSYPYIAELENGAKRASSNSLTALAAALGLSVSELVARAEALRDLPPTTTSRPLPTPPAPPASHGVAIRAARSWFSADEPPAAAEAVVRAGDLADEAAGAAAAARRAADEPLTEDRVREIVRDELRALGLLPPDTPRRSRRR